VLSEWWISQIVGDLAQIPRAEVEILFAGHDGIVTGLNEEVGDVVVESGVAERVFRIMTATPDVPVILLVKEVVLGKVDVRRIHAIGRSVAGRYPDAWDADGSSVEVRREVVAHGDAELGELGGPGIVASDVELVQKFFGYGAGVGDTRRARREGLLVGNAGIAEGSTGVEDLIGVGIRRLGGNGPEEHWKSEQ